METLEVSNWDKDTLLARLRHRANILPNGCWQAINPSGEVQSRIEIDKRHYYVVRVSAYIYKDFSIHNTHLAVYNTCDTKNCWNPEHLFISNSHTNPIVGTDFVDPHPEITVCKYGHALTPDNVYFYREKDEKARVRKYCRQCRLDSTAKYLEGKKRDKR
jgi:hypothetical protein